MEPLVVISSDCHAGLPPERYRDYVSPQYRDTFDVALPIQLAEVRAMAKKFLVADINEEWRQGRDQALSGAWDHDERLRVLDGDGIAGEIIFPDGITEMNMPPFGAGLSLPTDSRIVPELQWEGARAHNRWLAEFCAMAPERRAGVALAPICWDVDEAVREIRWVREHGLRGILIPSMWGRRDAYHRYLTQSLHTRIVQQWIRFVHEIDADVPNVGIHRDDVLGEVGVQEPTVARVDLARLAKRCADPPHDAAEHLASCGARADDAAAVGDAHHARHSHAPSVRLDAHLHEMRDVAERDVLGVLWPA